MCARSSMMCNRNGGSRAGAVSWLLLVVVICSRMAGIQAWDCAAADRQTLLEFKAGFVDRGGVFSTWNASTNCCTWSGVTCRESDGAVLDLTIAGASGSTNQQSYRDRSNCKDTVGANLASLADLQKLTIQWVLFDGPIPSQWGDFSGNLQVVVINNANLRNEIPSCLASIPNLRTLDLRSNHLTGAIPAAFCDQLSISYIDVSFNDMNYLLVPACLQQHGHSHSRSVTVVYSNQGQSSSPGAPALSAGVVLSAPSISFGSLSPAAFLLSILLSMT